ncbi:unnamed protein product, partial [Adineta steineri]
MQPCVPKVQQTAPSSESTEEDMEHLVSGRMHNRPKQEKPKGK